MRMNEPKKKIDHMVFNVRNLEEAVRFYTGSGRHEGGHAVRRP